MFLIPGKLIAILTFPGVIVHEFAHMLFCRLRGVAVYDACYFQVDDTSGYVIHEASDNFQTTFLISMGPFLVNSLLCILIAFPAYIPLSFFERPDPVSAFALWLSVSIGMHAIPSNQDARNVFDEARIHARRRNPLAIISFPLVLAVYIFNLLRFFWFDFLYAITIASRVPSLFFA